MCGHLGPPQDPDCCLDEVVAEGNASAGRLASLRRLLLSRAGIADRRDGTEEPTHPRPRRTDTVRDGLSVMAIKGN